MGGAPLLWPPSFAARSPRSEARHSCDLPRRGAHSHLRMWGGGGVEGPFNMVREQPSEPRRHSCGVPQREYALTPRGGAGRDRPTWSKNNPTSRGATQVAYLGVSTLVPGLRDINNKVAPPCRGSGSSAGLRLRWHLTYAALLRRGKPSRRAFVRGGISLMWPSSDAANPALGGRRLIVHPPVPQPPYGLLAASFDRGASHPRRPTRLLHRGVAHRCRPSAGCVSR